MPAIFITPPMRLASNGFWTWSFDNGTIAPASSPLWWSGGWRAVMAEPKAQGPIC
ncbi:MAG: hypothetical protein ACLRIS_13750 [Flavonifractor plautii]